MDSNDAAKLFGWLGIGVLLFAFFFLVGFGVTAAIVAFLFFLLHLGGYLTFSWINVLIIAVVVFIFQLIFNRTTHVGGVKYG